MNGITADFPLIFYDGNCLYQIRALAYLVMSDSTRLH